MKRSYFKCLIKLSAIHVFVVQYLSDGALWSPTLQTMKESSEDGYCFGMWVAREIAWSNRPLDFLGLKTQMLQVIDNCNSKTNQQVIQKVSAFISKYYDYSYNSDALDNTVYFSLKKDLFEIMGMIQEIKEADPTVISLDVYYKATTDQQTEFANTFVSTSDVTKFLKTGKL